LPKQFSKKAYKRKTDFETPSAAIVFHADLAENQDHDVQQLEAEGGDDVMLDEALLHTTSEFSFHKSIKMGTGQVVFVLPME
jgi:hypothetical protein